jgi:sugar phosphate isomerase/epimerase
MQINRRNFIQKAGIYAATPLLINELLACSGKGNSETTDSTAIKASAAKAGLDTFGIQLWTVKEEIAKDPKATLKALASYGYKQIESCDTGKGIFWGMTASDFKKYLDEVGLTIISSHCNPDFTTKKEKEDEFKKLADDAASIGMKYLINPFPGETISSSKEYKILADGLNRQGEICKAAGLKMAYHNHHIEFLTLADHGIGEEILLNGTDPNLVDFELDLYWVVKAGNKPKDWFAKYPNRFKLVHVKDFYSPEKMAEIQSKEKQNGFWPVGGSTELGKGRIDFPTILAEAKSAGVEYFVVEQERFDGSTPLDSAKLDADYMKAFKFA